MQRIHLHDEYPVLVEVIDKSATDCRDLNAVVARLSDQVKGHPASVQLGVFDHYAHVRAQPEGRIAEGIQGSKNLMFCLSTAIPDPLIGAVCPRSLSVTELADRFLVCWMQAPTPAVNEVIAGWLDSLRRR